MESSISLKQSDDKVSQFLEKVRVFRIKITPKRTYEKRIHRYVDFLLKTFEDSIRDRVNSDITILDLGGGAGSHAIKLVDVLAGSTLLVLLDVDYHNMYRAKMHRRLNPIVADAEYLPFKDESFDVVYSFSLIEHLKDVRRGLEEMSRVAKEVICIQIPNLMYFVELHTSFPLLYLMPQSIKSKVIKATIPDATLNFQVTIKYVIETLDRNGFQLRLLHSIFHYGWLKILIFPQGYIASFARLRDRCK